MAITTMDQLLQAMPGQHRHFQKASLTSEGAGLYHSLWAATGLPGAGSTPVAFGAGSGYLVDKTAPGAINYVNAGAGLQNYLARFQVACSAIGTLILYDRLWTCSGLLTTGGTPPVTQTVVTPETVARGGTDDIELWLEVYGAPGATGATWTVSYTDVVNGAGRTATYAHPANAESVGQIMPMALQAGDTSVTTVASFTYSASSGTNGSIGITLLRRIAEIPIMIANSGQILDSFGVGLPALPDDACLALAVLCSGVATGVVLGALDIVAG
jgi:hypothetical protein